MPLYPVDYSDERALRAAWSWQARFGIGPRFGSTSIHNYQNAHAAADKLIAEMVAREVGSGAEPVRVRVKGDYIEAESSLGWVRLARIADVWASMRW